MPRAGSTIRAPSVVPKIVTEIVTEIVAVPRDLFHVKHA